MNSAELMDRFEELSAGRALGDLTAPEERELAALSQQLGLHPDEALDFLAATIEIEAIGKSPEPLPADLAARLHRQADAMGTPAPTNVVQPPASIWGGILRSPLTGWAVAAAVAFGAWIGTRPTPKISPSEAQAALRAQAPDLIEHDFQGLGAFEKAGGKVVWSDQLQQGYMTLTGIPANDPSKSQYQLWIVDPKRDEAPVDGGVFDIPADGGPVVVPISAKLALTNPQAFVITLEQPGGVVKSKQEQVVALAKG